MSPTSLPHWPPTLTEAQHTHLINLSISYALSHGLTLLPPSTTSPPSFAIAAPLSLFPTPFPRGLYHLAREIQPLYNALYARVALDWAFLDRVMGGSVSRVDTFQGELWRGWKRIREEVSQPIHLGIFRSDYLLHSAEPADPLDIKQVEFNTIAASFGALSQRAGEMHRYLADESDMYFGSDKHLEELDAYPPNESLREIAAGLAEGWKAYGEEEAVVLFVVQDGERNVFDQRWLQYELLEEHDIKTVRHTFAELAQLAHIDPESKRLLLPSPLKPNTEPVEVAVIYYRSAYTPTDYPSSAEWDTRMLLERSLAIKCPTMALQLAGAKKIQQVLAESGVLEDFLLGEGRPDVGFGQGAGTLTQADVEKLRKTWIGLWPMDDSELGLEAYRLAMEESHRFVLKPQREGGGNNIYRSNIPTALRVLEKQERGEGEPKAKEAYILMELIRPPEGLSNWLVRGGENRARKADVVSELGVYGVMLFGEASRGVSGENEEMETREKVEVVNREAGTLLRTKGRESDEGGVAIGISSIDSPLLV